MAIERGGSGLGRAAALELSAGACGRVRPPARAASETAALADGGRCEALSCDIREEDQVGALVDEVLGRHGRIDLLVNNAGGQYLTPAEDITPKGFSTVMRLNVEGTWLMTHAVATRAMMGDEGDAAAGLGGAARSSTSRSRPTTACRGWPTPRRHERRSRTSPAFSRSSGRDSGYG